MSSRKLNHATLTNNRQTLFEQAQDIINTRTMFGNRDLGTYSPDDFRAIPTKPNTRVIKVTFSTQKYPPFSQSGNLFQRAFLRIPDVKPAMKFKDFKKAFKPFNSGKYKLTCNLNNGRKIGFYGNADDTLEKRLEEYLELTSAQIVGKPRISRPSTKFTNSNSSNTQGLNSEIMYPNLLVLIDYTSDSNNPQKTEIPLYLDDLPDYLQNLEPF